MDARKPALFVLAVAIALAPLFFGAMNPVAGAGLIVLCALALVLSPIDRLDGRHWAILAALAILALALCVVAALQVAAGPWVPSAERDRIVRLLGSGVSASGALIGQYVQAMVPALAAIFALAAGLVLGTGQRACRALIEVFLWVASVYAIFGIVQHLVAPGYVLWLPKEGHFEDLTATFTNRNTAAVFFGIACVWASLRVLRALKALGGGWEGEGKLAVEAVPSGDPRKRLFSDLVRLALCFTALLMTHSRAGGVLSIGACALAAGLFMLFNDSRFSRSGRNIFVGVAGFAVLSVLIHGRLNLEGFGDGGRFEAYRSAWEMVWQRPMIGLGLGSFETYFPIFRSGDMSVWGTWDRAHNVLLQVAVEAGVPVAALSLVFSLAVLGLLLRALVKRRKVSHVTIGSLAILALVLGHSLVDFSLQIPGLAVPVLILVGAGISQSMRMSRSGR